MNVGEEKLVLLQYFEDFVFMGFYLKKGLKKFYYTLCDLHHRTTFNQVVSYVEERDCMVGSSSSAACSRKADQLMSVFSSFFVCLKIQICILY